MLFSSQSSTHFMFALWTFAIQSITCFWVFAELWIKKRTRRMCCFKWQDWIECVQSGREWNNYLPKAGKLNAHSKVLEGFQEINRESGFFLPKEHTQKKLFTLNFTGLLNQADFFMSPCQYSFVMHHFSAQPSLNKRWLEQTMATSKYLFNVIQARLCLLQGTNCSLSQCRAGREKPLKATGHWSCTTNQHSTGTKPVICGTTQ